jgi:phosphoglycolate phosphatase-like HAD superfamily hydrolase
VNAEDAIMASTGAEDVATSKPAPDLVQRAMHLADTGPADVVFVGDTVWDVYAAREAGVGCVALMCGGSCADELLRAGALAVYEDPRALLLELSSSPLSRFG